MSRSGKASNWSTMSRARAAFRTTACDILGCEVPIILAGMGGVARSELVTAVSEAGGYGFLGMVREPPELIRAQIKEVRADTMRSFGVNLIPAATPRALLEKEVQVCIEEKVHSVCLFWDVDTDIISTLRANDILTVCQVGTLADAEQALSAGAQILIAQGVEAGGHVRGKEPLAAFLKAVVNMSDEIPVLAAGGIASGSAFANALDCGASGVVLGTAFLATHESFAHDYHKSRIVAGSSADTILTDMFHINWPKGAAVRVLKNSVTSGKHGAAFDVPLEMIGEEDGRPLYRFGTDSPLRVTTGDLESMALYAGQGVDFIAEVVSVEDRICEMLSNAFDFKNIDSLETDTALLSTGKSSPVCYASEADDAYMGFLSRTETADFLNALLEAERAGSRATARLIIDTSDLVLRSKLKILYANEVFSCGFLVKEITTLGGTPLLRNRESYENVILLGNEARLAFLATQQDWIIRKLRENLPRIRNDDLYAKLEKMLALHEGAVG